MENSGRVEAWDLASMVGIWIAPVEAAVGGFPFLLDPIYCLSSAYNLYPQNQNTLLEELAEVW